VDSAQLRQRTKDFAKRVVNLCRHLPKNREGFLVGDQIFRSGTSVGSNYRAVCRARSKADFISKLGVVLEEADETLYWLEILAESDVVGKQLLKPLMNEADELVSIFVASLNKAKRGDS